MNCPKCGFEQVVGGLECLKCGVVFAKLISKQPHAQVSASKPEEAGEAGYMAGLKDMFLTVHGADDPRISAAKGLLWLILCVWGGKLIFSSIESNYVGESFLHLINLPFHEAGHILFMPFGRFLQVLGGSLMQLVMPAVCMVVLLVRTRDAFGAAVVLWWLGENFLDLAPYINDARALDLILLGGVTGKDVADYHDWEFILGRLGMFRFDHALAYMAKVTGTMLMITALVWAATVLWLQFQGARETKI